MYKSHIEDRLIKYKNYYLLNYFRVDYSIYQAPVL